MRQLKGIVNFNLYNKQKIRKVSYLADTEDVFEILEKNFIFMPNSIKIGAGV